MIITNRGCLKVKHCCIALLALFLISCTSFKPPSKKLSETTVTEVPKATEIIPISYRVISETGPGASRMYSYSYVFPANKMAKNGSVIEKMTPTQNTNGEIQKWNPGSQSSLIMTRRVEKAFERDGYNLITFPQLLEWPEPYSVLVVSTFYTKSMAIKNPQTGGPNRTVTLKVKGALFGSDLDPEQSLPIGVVLCSAFYVSGTHNLQEVTDKVLDIAVRYLGRNVDSSGEF